MPIHILNDDVLLNVSHTGTHTWHHRDLSRYPEFRQALGDYDEMKFWWAVGQMLCSELFLISAVHNNIILD
jgi:hypothetical protein